ncbi:hypothetical protein [Cupriavidus nantongensis]|uniref:Uncharacterized protein n=1 Tax=Cupriavidus nantongensis TaxID=1796606 RepID=A0A142JGT7_9BURK|nr:hypothetical protein [Cupriavidus nantongensis]AMR77299.1 hypothetical protein A2G96_05885 [Cupriavidus nantongensis]
MATKTTPKPAPAPSQFADLDDAGQYRVTLSDRLPVFGQVFYPGQDLVLRGDVVKQHADVILTAESASTEAN